MLLKSMGLMFLSHKSAFYDSSFRFMEIIIIFAFIQQISHLKKVTDYDVFDI